MVHFGSVTRGSGLGGSVMSRRVLIIVSAIIAACYFVVLSLRFPAAAAATASLSSDTLPRRPFFGVTAQPAPDHHVRVSKIIPGSSAARSDLPVGDILLSIGCAPVGAVDAFVAGLKPFKSGDRLVSRVQRGGREMDIEVILGEWPRE